MDQKLAEVFGHLVKSKRVLTFWAIILFALCHRNLGIDLDTEGAILIGLATAAIIYGDSIRPVVPKLPAPAIVPVTPAAKPAPDDEDD